MATDYGRDPTGQALAVPATPANAVDGPPGFDPSRVWRCFHCGETFTDHKLAEDHFGQTTLHPSACVDPLRSDERAMRERAMFYERAWRQALQQRDDAWALRDSFAQAVFMVGNMDTEQDKRRWWEMFEAVWQQASAIATEASRAETTGSACEGAGLEEALPETQGNHHPTRKG